MRLYLITTSMPFVHAAERFGNELARHFIILVDQALDDRGVDGATVRPSTGAGVKEGPPCGGPSFQKIPLSSRCLEALVLATHGGREVNGGWGQDQ